jgi:Ca-activated chloride channel homolog
MQVVTGRLRHLSLIGIFFIFFVSGLNGQNNTPPPAFRVEVDTVYLKVAVTDPLRRYVTGLEKEYFKVYEDKIEQPIIHFSQESAPISVGFIFDVSNSMGHNRNIRISKNWFIRFLKNRNPQDEFFLITFNEKINLVESFTKETSELQGDIAVVKTGGWTALYDAVYRGLDKVKEGKNEKKALIVISDGEENSSRYRWREVRESFKESDVPIYGIGYDGPMGGGNYVLQDMANITGGRVFGGRWDDSINLIFTELRNQYLLGYAPANKTHDGKWRSIKVVIDPPPGFPKLKIRTKRGYYSSKF